MPHFILFCFKIKKIVSGGIHLYRYTLFDLNSESAELIDLIGIIRQQTESFTAEIAQYLSADIILPHITGKSQSKIGFKGIHSLILQLVGIQLVYQTDP